MNKRHSKSTAQPAEIIKLINLSNSNPFTNQIFIAGSNQAAEEVSQMIPGMEYPTITAAPLKSKYAKGKPQEASQQSTHRGNLSADTFNSMTAEYLNQTSFDNLSNINIQPHDISILIFSTIRTDTDKLREATQQASISRKNYPAYRKGNNAQADFPPISHGSEEYPQELIADVSQFITPTEVLREVNQQAPTQHEHILTDASINSATVEEERKKRRKRRRKRKEEKKKKNEILAKNANDTQTTTH
jgi:hypothetical protein